MNRASLPSLRAQEWRLQSRSRAAHSRPCRQLLQQPRQRLTTCQAVQTVASASEAKQLLTEEQLGNWESCVVQVMSSTGLSEEDAERLIAKGHAWTSQAYWGADKANIVPEPEHVESVLDWLQTGLGLEGSDLQKVIKLFPEALACSLEERLQPNVQRFEKEWFMKGDVLKRAIVRKPTLLGLSVDCSTVASGACMGQCSKCWSAN